MRLRDYLSDHVVELEKRDRLDSLINTIDLLHKSSSDKGRMDTIGVDTIVSAWVRQQFEFREQLLEDLFTISRTVSEISAPILHLKNEVFRRGITWEAKFAKKCEKCGEEYETIVEECEKCGSKELRDADESQLDKFKMFVDDCNIFDQSLEDVLKEFHESVNSVDDAYLYANKEYNRDNGGEIFSKPIEFRALRTSAVEFDLDETGLPKNKHWLCLFHRDKTPKDKEGLCDIDGCGAKLVPAMYRYKHRGNTLYFTDSEICHVSKFHPSSTYGFSPILTLFEKALTLIGMDRTIFRYFFERKMPASLLLVGTDDPQSIPKVRAQIISQVRSNPDYIPMVGYSPRSNRGRVDMVRLFHTLQEMDYLPVRQEIRERVAAIWGLPPMWQAEYAGFGGLSGQSQQLVQFSRVVESDQRMFNEKVFPFIMDAFGVTEWDLQLEQPEEKAEATRIQFAQQRVMIAGQLTQLGFKVDIKEGVQSVDDLDFKVSGERQEMGMGGFPGMPGGGAPPPEMGGEQPPGEEPFQFSVKGWTNQIIEKGYSLDSVENINALNNGVSAITFYSKGNRYIAAFQPLGSLIDIYNANPMQVPKKKDTLLKKPKQESQVFKPDKPEEPEDEIE